MSDMPRSYIEIDGLKVEGDSKTVLVYVLAVRNALVKLRERGEYDTWVSYGGTIDVDSDGVRIDTARHAQGVRLRTDSAVNYQIVEDSFSSELFNTGDLGKAGDAFIAKYAPSEEDSGEADDI